MTKSFRHSSATFTNKKTYSSSDFEQFLNDVRTFDNTIGHYDNHLMLDDKFTYTVELTNGTIKIYAEELDDKNALPQERFRDIAARFRERKISLF